MTQSKAIKVLDKMIDAAVFCHNRSGRVLADKIGEITNNLSAEDREAIQELKSEEIEHRNSPYVFYKDDKR